MMTDKPSRPIRVLLADDDHLVRAGIAGLLATAPDIEVIAEAPDGNEALRAAAAHRIDVALLDIQMPRLNGIEAMHAIRQLQPDLPVAMLTTFSDDHLIAEAVSAGALGFLLKSDEPTQLINSVRALARGGGAFSPRVARWLAAREQTHSRAEQMKTRVTELLSERQLELLSHIGHGLSNSQIAQIMHLSEGTVKQYVSILLNTLGVENRVQAALIAFRAGLVT
ncbi:MAG TPA: response regulator transcription factor [Enteractinococcus sp.]